MFDVFNKSCWIVGIEQIDGLVNCWKIGDYEKLRINGYF